MERAEHSSRCTPAHPIAPPRHALNDKYPDARVITRCVCVCACGFKLRRVKVATRVRASGRRGERAQGVRVTPQH